MTNTQHKLQMGGHLKDGPAFRHVVYNSKIYDIVAWDNNSTPKRVQLENIETEEAANNLCPWISIEEIRDVTPEDYKRKVNDTDETYTR